MASELTLWYQQMWTTRARIAPVQWTVVRIYTMKCVQYCCGRNMTDINLTYK